MIGSIGFQFDNAPATVGVRKPAANFRNRLSGSITALDEQLGLLLLNGQPFQTELLESSRLLVSATNIINEGLLTAGHAGLIRFEGTNVNLARSGVLIEALQGLGSFNRSIFTNFYIPDVGIYDVYWGQSNQVANTRNIIRRVGGGPVV